jgi:hypothetical protein
MPHLTSSGYTLYTILNHSQTLMKLVQLRLLISMKWNSPFSTLCDAPRSQPQLACFGPLPAI